MTVRVLDIFDGYSSVNPPNIIGGVASQLSSYDSDASYILDNGTPVGSEIYYNTTTGKIRYFNGLINDWKNIGAGLASKHEELIGTVDGLNLDFQSTLLPIGIDAFWLFRNGLKVESDQYTLSGAVASFITAPPIGSRIEAIYLTEGDSPSPVIISGVNNVQYYSITLTDIMNKYFELSPVPAEPSKIQIDVINGSTQRINIDYQIISNQVHWNALSWDGLVEIGDTFRIQYFS
jgi:hypothetical protein